MAAIFLALALTFGPPPLHISAASSLTDVLQELGRMYQKETGQAATFNFGSSGTLARQIIEGGPADLFVSADERQMDRVASQRLIEAATRHSVASNALVVVVPRDSRRAIRALGDLESAASIAVGDPLTVPAGNYARAYLERAGVWKRIAPKTIPFENVRAALAAVESGNVDCGIVYRTDAMISKEARVAFTIEGQPPISYPAAVIATSRNQASARRFLDFLLSPAAQRVFARYGFTPARRKPPSTAAQRGHDQDLRAVANGGREASDVADALAVDEDVDVRAQLPELGEHAVAHAGTLAPQQR